MRLSRVPDSETRGCDRCDRDANDDQPDEQPNASDAAPVKRQENRDRGDDEHYDQRNGNGKITSLALESGDVKRCRQGRAESKTEKESSADANNSADNSEKNCANGEFIYRGRHKNV